MERRHWTTSGQLPSISVVVPLYNHARFIGAALESVLSQTLPVDEIIVIDDGSTDGGITIAETILASQSNARLYRQPNQGAHVALNRLVGMSRGAFIAILNSDDLFEPMKLDRCRELLLRQPGTAMICGPVGLIDENGSPLSSGIEFDWLQRARAFYNTTGHLQLALLNENFVATTSNMVFSRDLWHNVGGFQNLRFCHDLDFLMSAFTQGTVIVDDMLPHISYRVHPRNTIKEDLLSARLEIAAVVATTLCESGSRLAGPNLESSDIRSFRDVVRRKGDVELISMFQAIFPGFNSRAAFYDFIADAGRRDRLLQLMLD